jgi:hypothetical protein
VWRYSEVLNKTFSCCPGSNYPQVFFYLAFTRYNVDYLRNIFVPVCLSVIVGFLAYWIPVDEGERLGLGVTCLLTVLAVMFITNDTLPATRDFTLLSMFYLGSLCYTLMPLIGSAVVIALNNLGDTVMTRGTARNQALETLWEITSELMEEEQAAEEAVVAANMGSQVYGDAAEADDDGNVSTGPGGVNYPGGMMYARSGYLMKKAASGVGLCRLNQVDP